MFPIKVIMFVCISSASAIVRRFYRRILPSIILCSSGVADRPVMEDVGDALDCIFLVQAGFGLTAVFDESDYTPECRENLNYLFSVSPFMVECILSKFLF